VVNVKVALIGCGRIGQVHAASIAAHADATLVRVCDAVADAAVQVADRFGGTPGTDVDAVLSDRQVDVVVIASSTPTHVDLLARAIEAGKAVLCEKPIDLDIERVRACRARVGDRIGRVMIGFNRRFDPSFRAVQTRVAAGEIGRLEQLIIISRDPAPSSAAYLATSGGLFRDMTIHDFDMARFFLGEVVEVSAVGSNLVADYIAELGDVDGAMVTLRGRDGALCQITNSRRAVFGYDQRLEAFGSTGMLSVDNLRPDGVRAFTASTTEAAAPYLDFFLDRYTPAYRAEFDHFVTSVAAGTTPSPGFDDGEAALVLADAATESVRTGRAVAVDPESTRTVATGSR
jgi:myo-inositol 2-dehydrogenase/D-chiro-inositol 1-dehydrogenase